MNDKELLELAAKAAGLDDWRWYEPAKCLCHYNVKMGSWYGGNYGDKIEWTPLTDDGDALRLAVKLGICISPGSNSGSHQSKYAVATGDIGEILQLRRTDPYAATRRAVVMAAAEIGKGME
jgi:hypothetical protein